LEEESLGVGHAVRTVYNGVRTSSADFVEHFNKPNLVVRTGVYVNRIILEKNNDNDSEYKAIGVEAFDDVNNQSIVIKAKREIILSAG